MKKILFCILPMVLLITGCTLFNGAKDRAKTLEEQFEEEVLAIYNHSENWLTEEEDNRTALLTLEDLKDVYKKDISKYVNEETGKPCDGRNSFVILTIERIDGEIKTDTEVHLKCPAE